MFIYPDVLLYRSLYKDKSSISSINMEKIICENETFEIPSGLSDDFSHLTSIISPDTWNNILNDDHRTTLLVCIFVYWYVYVVAEQVITIKNFYFIFCILI